MTILPIVEGSPAGLSWERQKPYPGSMRLTAGTGYRNTIVQIVPVTAGDMTGVWDAILGLHPSQLTFDTMTTRDLAFLGYEAQITKLTSLVTMCERLSTMEIESDA